MVYIMASYMRAAEFIQQSKNIPAAFHALAASRPKLEVYSQAHSDGNDTVSKVKRKWTVANYAEVQRYVNAIAAYLLAEGVQKGQSIAILSGSRPEWLWADIAALSCGAKTVSVYQSLPAEDVAYILFDSDSEIVFAENAEQVAKLLELNGTKQKFPATEDRPETEAAVSLKKIIAFETVDRNPLVVQLSSLLDNLSAAVPPMVDQITRDDIASLVYTSGTTGPPKGVIQTHGNHLSNVRQAYDSELVTEETTISIILPLAHSFAKLMGYLGFLTPAQLRFPAVVDRTTSKVLPQSILKDVREGSAHVNPVVPRLLEKMRDGVLYKSKQKTLAGKLLRTALWAAEENFAAKKRNEQPSFTVCAAYLLTAPLRTKMRNILFGPNLKFCLSGGAKLPVTVAEFFNSLGMTVIEGYGLTETCVATNVGRVKRNKIGTVGPVMASDIEMRIAEDGEIIYRGPNIAKGYFKRPTATNKVWDEQGWFYTGDLGSVDSDGYLSIVGRKKDLIVTSGGKNIAPHDIEVAIKKSPLVSQAVLIGDGRKYCIALLSLFTPEAKNWAASQGIPAENLHENKALHDKILEHVSEVNADLASYETVKKFYIVPDDFSVENGQMTPTFKIKRNVVEKVYEQQINALYPS